jgi:hypothetical protein
LPELIVPYGRYSILFMLMALKSYYLRSISGETVVGVAMRYEIAVSTLYRWKVLFEEHKRLWLGVLASVSEDVGRFIEKFISERSESSGLLCGFTLRFGFSFMQGGTYASRYSMGRAGP